LRQFLFHLGIDIACNHEKIWKAIVVKIGYPRAPTDIECPFAAIAFNSPKSTIFNRAAADASLDIEWISANACIPELIAPFATL
jgi:hypothetical protein